MKAFLFCYPLVALLLGTVSGSASWLREAGMHALVVLALGAAFLAAKRQERWPLLGGFFEPLLALLLVVMVAGALQSPCTGRSWRMLLLAAAAAAVFYLVVGLVSSGRLQPAATLQLVLPATGTAAAVVGLSLYFLGRTPRVVAPLGHHNYMAGFLLLHLPLTARAAAAARSNPARLFWYAATAAQALAIVLTGSLAGVLVLTGLGLVALVSRLGFSRVGFRKSLGPQSTIRSSKWQIVALLALAALAAVVFLWSRSPVVAGLRGRVAAIVAERSDLSLEHRLRYLRAGLSVAAARPLVGWGLGATPFAASLHREQTPGLSPPGEVLPQLHSLPANLLAETGVLGLAAALLLVLTTLRLSTGPAATALCAYLIFSLGDYQLDLPAILFPLAIVAGFSVATSPPASPKAEPSSLLRWLAMGGLFLLSLTGAALLGRSLVAHYFYQRDDPAQAAQWDARCGFYAFRAGGLAEQQTEANQTDANNTDVNNAARRFYLEAAKRMPNLIPVAAQAGSSLMQAGRYSDALPWLERATELDYYFTLAHFHLGRARLRTGDRTGAIEAFSTALLVQPATVTAEDWLRSPEREVYSESLERALDRLYELAAFHPESGPWPESGPRRRWNELGDYLIGRRNQLPAGLYRVLFFELVDRDLTVNHSLIVFRRAASPLRVAPVVLLSPTPNPRPPAGLGVIAGLPSLRALDLKIPPRRTLAEAPPVIGEGGIVNGASFSPEAVVSPGSIASLFGMNLAAATVAATWLPLPTMLAGTEVLVNDTPAPLFFVSPSQINFQMPFEVTGTTVRIVVASGGVRGPEAMVPVMVRVAPAAPGIFTAVAGGRGPGAVLNEDFSPNSAENPAAVGSVVQIFATGLGPTDAPLATGQPGASSPPFNLTAMVPVVAIGGASAEVLSSGMAPGFVGLYQVNARVPTGAPAGDEVLLEIKIGGSSSNTVTLAVR